MNFEELMARLKELDVPVPPGTIRRWATEGHITPPSRRPKSKGEGRGTVSDWSQQSLEEIAAVWAVRQYGSGRRNLFVSIKQAKAWAELFYQDPLGWERTKQKMYEKIYGKGKVIESILARDGDDPDLHLGKMIFFMDSCDFIQWVAAIEKVRKEWAISTYVHVNFLFIGYGNIEKKTLHYKFAGVGLKETEKTDTMNKPTEIHVITERVEALQKRGGP